MKENPPGTLFLAILTLIVAMVSVQTGASLAKQLFPLLGPQGTTTLRVLFAALILAIIWRPWNGQFTRKEFKNILYYGAALGGMNLCFYMALQRIPLGIAVAFEFTGPLAIAFMMSRRPIDFLWALLASGGILLILPLSTQAPSLDYVGVGLALLAGFFWALYILFGQKASSSDHGGMVTTLGMAMAALVTLPFGVISVGKGLFNPQIIPLALAVAILSSALPYYLEMKAMKKIPPRPFSILMSLEPAIAACSGMVILKEHLLLTQWLGMSMIILASMGTTLSMKK